MLDDVKKKRAFETVALLYCKSRVAKGQEKRAEMRNQWLGALAVIDELDWREDWNKEGGGYVAEAFMRMALNSQDWKRE